MPKEKKTTKKSRVTIENDGNTIEQVFDYGKFKKMFEQWKTDCGKSGEDLHTKSTTTLFTTVTNHGKSGSHRPQSRDKSTIGAGEIVEKLDKLISDAYDVTEAWGITHSIYGAVDCAWVETNILGTSNVL